MRSTAWSVRAELDVLAKPGARKASITRRGDDVVVAVREPAIEGRANAAIERAIAEWLDVPVSRVRLVHGATGRRKRLVIDGVDPDTIIILRDRL
jgi:hypothetical protein